MLGPLICEEQEVSFVKAHFRRPYAAVEGDRRPVDGGRVTELTARPLLSAFYPELAAFVQPLAGEVAARRSFFDELPFATGYAIETSMLLHARDLLGGTEGMAQVDLEERHNSHQSLRALGPMAYAVLRVILERLRAEGRLTDDHVPPFQTADGQLIQVELVERPPYATLRARA
jgi:glucosyl-3-phosphoglycerate synthase